MHHIPTPNLKKKKKKNQLNKHCYQLFIQTLGLYMYSYAPQGQMVGLPPGVSQFWKFYV